jgi:hypothetical protein
LIVYHGSYCIVDSPHVSFSRDALDFGKGFYVTSIKDQAISWTNRFKRRGKSGYLNTYSLEVDKINKEYKVKVFSSYDTHWLEFILECREGNNNYLNYDMIIGGIADDKVYNTIELYQDNLIGKEEALRRLEYHKPNHQICIVNQEVIDKYLIYKEVVKYKMEANKILLQTLYKKIILEFSKRTGKGLEESMDYFYNSDTYELISSGVADLHCRGAKYLADELMLEYGIIEHKGYPKDLVRFKN